MHLPYLYPLSSRLSDSTDDVIFAEYKTSSYGVMDLLQEVWAA